MEKQVKAFGFAAMKFMETKDLEFEHEFRQFQQFRGYNH